VGPHILTVRTDDLAGTAPSPGQDRAV
jgi:hypothetical protein